MKMSGFILAAGLLMTGLAAEARPPSDAVQTVRYDPHHGSDYNGNGRLDRQDRHQRRGDRRHWNRQRGHYGYGRGSHCRAEWRHGRRVRICR